jgi:raffinose/stachyose/melibiose transport system permease protein
MKRKHDLVFWMFLAPVILAFVFVLVIPFVIGIYYSFTNWATTSRANSTMEVVGLTNFIESIKDPRFTYSFGMTIAYTIGNIFTVNAVALVLALAVTSKLKLKNTYRMGFFIPNLIGGLILGYIWQFIFNNAIPSLGKTFFILSDLAIPENLILSKVGTSMMALVAVGTWQYAGYIMMIYIAALEGVPQELHEAAELDGANYFQRFRAVTVPMIAQAFTVTLFLTLVNSFKQFDVNVSLTAGGPSTIYNGTAIFGTELLAMNIYNTAFVANNMAQAQARAVIFFLVLVIISIIQVRINKRKEIEL